MNLYAIGAAIMVVALGMGVRSLYNWYVAAEKWRKIGRVLDGRQ